MPTSLAAVIRLQRWQVDAERRSVNEADAALRAIEAALDVLARTCEAERRHATASIETSFAFAAFLGRTRLRRQALEEQRTEAAACLEAARARLATAYREQRKFELAEAEQRRRAAAEQAKKDQQALDEMAINQQLRRRSGN